MYVKHVYNFFPTLSTYIFCETLSKIKSALAFVAMYIMMCVPISATKKFHIKKEKDKV